MVSCYTVVTQSPVLFVVTQKSPKNLISGFQSDNRIKEDQEVLVLILFLMSSCLCVDGCFPEKSCGNPGDVPNGRYDMTGGIDFGSTITAICDEG